MTGFFTGDSLRARTLRGSVLTFLNFGGQNFLRLLSNLILTRLLFPEAFGLMALVGVVLTAVSMFSDLGIRDSIIQDKRGEDPDFLNTAWTFQIMRGFLLAFIVLLIAQPMANFYDEPLLADLLTLSALFPVIRSFGSTNFVVANRKMHLGRLTAIMLTSSLVGLVVTIILAWWLQSVWALVIGSVFSPITMVVLSHTIIPGPRNRLHFEFDAARRLINFGKFIFISTIAGFFVQQGSNAILGKFVGLDELAFYRLGFFLATVPVILATALSDKIMYPIYSRRPPAESVQNRQNINRVRLGLTGGLMVLSAFFAMTGDWLIDLLYDDRYQDAGPLLILIAVFSLPLLILASYHKLPLSSGQSGRFAMMTLVNACALTILLLILVPTYGAAGAAMAPGIAVLVTYPFQLWIIAPYKGWDPVHDGLFIGLAVLIGATVYWFKWPILAPLFALG